jgi:uncharacterized caspase-like protein
MRPSRAIGLILLACAVVALNFAASTAEVREAGADASTTKPRRLALVVGNDEYPNAPLRNPVNDARDLATALLDSGFEVTKLENANLRQLRAAVRDFGDRLKKEGGVGLFYYAGHAMQLKGRNYLIPVGAQIEREDEIEFESLDVNMVLEKLDSAGNRFNIVILDACRNNPFARAFRSTAQGLAQMDAPSGTVIAFATAPGSVASDGPGRNGLYTQHLIEFVARPGLKLEDVFKQVRSAVRRDSNGQQIPWESTSLEGDFYFHSVAAAITEGARKQEEQARLEEMVRTAIARERELIRQEMEQARVQEGGRSKAPGAPAKAAPPSAAKAAVPVIAPGATPEAAVGPTASPVGVIGSRIEGKTYAPQFVVGDEWEILSVTSPASGSGSEPASWIDRITVVGVSEQRLSLSYTRLDRPGGTPVGQAGTYKVSPQLATLFDGKNAFDGQRKYLSFPLEVNASWAYSYEYPTPDRVGRFREDLECKVVGWEQVTVPAGTFWALRIEQRGWRNNVSPNAPSSGRRAARLERTFWYSPEVKYNVKSEFRRSSPVPGSAGGYSTHQLVRFSGATPRTPDVKAPQG